MDRRMVNQRETAELLGITEAYLSQLLNNKRQPGLDNAIKIERLTGIPVEAWTLSDVSKPSEASADTADNANVTKR
jgi:transcriptional regulator with XRE-family HTH domain